MGPLSCPESPVRRWQRHARRALGTGHVSHFFTVLIFADTQFRFMRLTA